MGALRAGAPADAIAVIQAAPAAQRNTQAAQRTLAAAYAQTGALESAQDAINRALRDVPVEPATRALAGRIALDRKQPAVAFVQFDALVQIAPQQMGFWRYLWDSASTPQSTARALALTRSHALDASMDVHVAWAVSRALAESGQVNDALQLAEQTMTRHPQSSAAHWLWIKRLTDELPFTALSELHRVPLPALASLDADAVDARLCTPEQFADDAAVGGWRSRYGAGIAEISARLTTTVLTDDERVKLVRHTAFRLAYHGRDDLSLQRARGTLMHALLAAVTPARVSNPLSTTGKLRVAFVSRHVRDCTVGQYFKRFFTDLDDDHIEVSVFASGQRDAFTDEVERSVMQLTHWLDDETPLAQMASAIAAATPDVLIYPEIGMEPLIEKLAAMRLAPLQCALWGHPVTTGQPTVDVFLSAAALEPANAQSHYSERLHLLPGLGTCYPRPPAASTLDRAGLGLPQDGPLLVCAQSPFKWNPPFTRAVGSILQQQPSARLVVFDSPAGSRSRVFDEFLARFFSPLGVDAKARVIRLPQRSRADFLAALAACDVALDTFGFSGGNTSLDALSVGLPVVTLPGEFMRGRQTFAMLKALQSEASDALIAQDEADYVRRVLALVADAAGRAVTREAIATNAHKLFDDPAPVAALRTWLLAQRKSVETA